MKSPFPGMDPYLEQHWLDVHASLIIYARDQLQPQLPGNLIARVEERLVVQPEDREDRSIYPDVRVVEESNKRAATGIALANEVDVAEPVELFYHEKATETLIRIVDPGTKNRLITVIEFLSLANKLPGPNRKTYREKQKELIYSRVNLVEIDLLRRGRRVFPLPSGSVPRKLRSTYQICTHRGWKPTSFEIHPAPLRRRLPVIAIPLRQKDKEVHLDLQSLLDQAYQNGRYGTSIDYSEPPEPPLAGADAEWAEELLKTRKR
ncbi:MAG: DUF4058 family protein [Gemmataceae bacterium]|nr:DUF4058 family protein [Gemmataceae bacterium]